MQSVSETTQEWATQREIEIVSQAQTGSTNDDAKKKAMSETAPVVLYVTAHQTGGRGRGGNQWLDTGAGESLLSTWSLAVASPPQAITAPRIGLALFTAASRTWPELKWGLKAPNDLYLDGLKAGGLLIESVSSGGAHRLLVGLGLNVGNHPRRFNTATHIAVALGRAIEEDEWFNFLDELKYHLDAALADCLKPQLTAAVCAGLKNALNANSARPFTVTEVTPMGDLVNKAGTVRWTDI